MSTGGKSCDDACIEKQKFCRPGNPKTLNSIYLFKKAGRDCNKIDTVSNGESYWKLDKQPLITSNAYCTGFLNVASFDCKAEAASGENRLCYCNQY